MTIPPSCNAGFERRKAMRCLCQLSNESERNTRHSVGALSPRFANCSMACRGFGKKWEKLENLFVVGLTPIFRDFEGLSVLNVACLRSIALRQRLPPFRLHSLDHRWLPGH